MRRSSRLATCLVGAIAAGLGLSLAACKSRPLPEADTAAASVYVQHCSQCHRAYDPRSMTASMWQTQVDAMDQKIRAAGMEPLTSDERRIIMDYLTRNAGKS
jgi:hypothetical protein